MIENLIKFGEQKMDRLHFPKCPRNKIINETQLLDIMKMISENPVSAIIAPTGSAKSTLLVEALARLGNARVFCAQAANAPVLGLYEYMKKLNPDLKIGYEAGGEVHYSDCDRIIYCTSGHLKNVMLSHFGDGILKKPLNFCDIIFLDEAHNSSLENDVIMGLWNQAVKFKDNKKVPYLVLASATLSIGYVPFNLENSHYEVKTESFDVKIEYSDMDYNAYDPRIYDSLIDIVSKKNNENPLKEKEKSKWLVFCPGKFEVDRVVEKLREKVKGFTTVLPCYAALPFKELEKIFIPANEGERVIIVSTNICETSLTIDDLDGVFDSMIEKIGMTSDTGAERLVTTHEPKSSAIQRKGRTGRVRDGFCYRMCSENFYNSLPSFRSSEASRLPLYQTFLGIVRVGFTPEQIFNRKLDEDKRRKTFGELVRNGLITKEPYRVTEIGDFVSKLPLTIKSGMMLHEWLKLSVNKQKFPIFPAIVAICIIEKSSDPYFWYPKSSCQDVLAFKKSYFNDHFKEFEGKTGLEMYLKMYLHYLAEFESINPSNEDIKKWCIENSLNFRAILDLTRVIRQVYDVVSRNHSVEIGLFRPFNVIRLFESRIFPKVYKDEKFTLADENLLIYTNCNGGLIRNYTVDGCRHFNPDQDIPKEIYAFSKITIGNGKLHGSGRKIINFFHPVKSCD